MGYSLSWLAVKGKSSQNVREELGLAPTGKCEAIPESDLTGAELPDGWYLVISQHSEKVASDTLLQRLSSGAQLVTCFVEEHVMCSSATGWTDGRKTWSVVHDAQQRRDHLDAEGDLPPLFNAIVSDLKARQQEAKVNNEPVDFLFDIPVTLAQRIVGYRYDKDVPGLNGDVFEVLSGSDSSKSSGKPSLFRRLFG